MPYYIIKRINRAVTFSQYMLCINFDQIMKHLISFTFYLQTNFHKTEQSNQFSKEILFYCFETKCYNVIRISLNLTLTLTLYLCQQNIYLYILRLR